MCKNPCLRPDVCGVNADCRVENHRPVCFCLPGFTGNPHDALRGCVRVPVSCSDDQQCPIGLICENRRCRPRCNSDADCARRELCKVGHCVLGCKQDPDCSAGEICVANNCIVGCRQDLDCSNYEACIQNTCTNPCESPTACGMNAICTVNQHHQICNCAPGFTGNPNIGCIRLLPSCVREADCAPNHYCLDGKCRVECTTDSECGAGEKCSNNHCLALCRKDDDCQQNEICITNRCQVGCRTNDQCNDHLGCVSNQCRDPCEGSATCGPNAECKVINHRPLCSCREGFIGRPNANVGCIRPQVVCIDAPCPPGLVCFNGRCRVPCTSVRDCAVNEKCVDNLCYVHCVRDRDCSSGEICIHNFCKAGCRSDSECGFNEACINNQCINPCASPTACGTNAQCDVINHEKRCTCPAGLEGDPNAECVRVSERCSSDDNCAQGRYCEASYCRVTCSSDSECFDNEKCIDKRCTIICTHDKSCFNGFICENGQCISGCRTDSECLLKEACINQQCLNPCASPTACGTNAQCQPVDHRPLCTCLPEHTGDPRVECSPVECIIDTDCGQGRICQNYKCHVGCRLDQSCLSDEVCISRQCQKVCHFSNTCGVNAICQAENHNFRCICPPNFIGNPHVECRKEEGLCTTSSDCVPGKVCINGRCEDDVECREDNDCLLGNICQQNKCFVGCRRDENCALDQACYNFQCQNPCNFGRNCGLNSKCDAIRHRPVCTCLPGYTGNAQVQCQPIGDVCRRDNDCDVGKVCISKKCTVISGCSSDNDCTYGQICENTKCIYGCRSDSDCGFTEACIEHQCQNPCQPGKCGTNAECRPINHQAVCRCPPDYTGKPELFCSPVKEECYVDSDCELEKICFSNRCISGCRTNAHCPLEKTCIRERCVNPCYNQDVCGTGAICRPVNHQEECICPPGTVGNAKVRCTAELKTECSRNSECPPNAICEQGVCVVRIGGCQSDSACNIGEICENEKCIVGCRRDSDCTYDKACFNSRCVNPCTVQDSCGRNADCRPVVHRPLCTCRPGYEGNAYDYCREIPPKPPVECVTDHDCSVGKICQATRCLEGCRRDENCPYDKTCIQRQCQNPCQLPNVCGLGANCLVHNHRPVCSCPAPLTGDPNVQCRPIPEDFCYNDAGCGSARICENSKCIDACRTHDTCPFDKACINRQCQDPCSFYGACGSGANCHAAYHEAKCTCPPGYTGNPKVHCTLIVIEPKGCQRDDECGTGSLCENGDCFEGCRNDYQCSLDKACVRRKCEPVCNQPGVCGTNAQCTADNHQPICTCLPGLVGDARVECKSVPQPECISDKECPIQHICEHEKCIVGCRNDQNCDLDEACINRICQNPCSVFGACGRNAICKPSNHKPECTCPSGYRGNPNVVCEEDTVPPECYTDHECSLGYICENNRCLVGCRHDNNCPHDRTCVNRQCQNPCLLPNVCGKNADCQPLNHRPICSCPRNFRGDPYISCELYVPGECQHDQECPIDKICENAKCIRGCRNDANCRFTETCINRLCQDPCTVFGACGQNAICKSLNHDRLCTCQPGYTGNPHVFCNRIETRFECIVDRNCSLSQICSNHRCIDGCRSNTNCPYDKTCINGRCHYVCELSGTCGKDALCTPVSHQAHCSCPSGYTGDPRVSCDVVVEPACRRDPDCAVGHICSKSECIPGCHSHGSCPFNQACINRVCRDPCSVGLVCGINTQCHQSDHQAICSCIPGYTGDPLKQCVRIQYQCEINEDCGRNFVCVNHECKDINECLQGKGPCAPQAMCTNLPGGFKCSCPEGMEGNPYHDGCRPKVVGCTRDEHCKTHEACNKRTGYCYDVCTRPGICGPGAQCTAANHHHECYCPSGYSGNPYIECSIIETCGPHNPCSGNLQCLGGTHCGCPSPFEQVGFFCILTSRNCTTTNPCQEHEQCVYSENKRGFCVCPRGFVLMTNGVCRDQNECDQSPFPCGPGAQCFNNIGSYRCQCPPGTVGEPFTSGCQRREGFCTSDAECPQDQACDLPSQQCYNPCIVKNPCGRNADCRVLNHAPRCDCPPGFRGNPLEYCYHILDCHNDYDCPGNLLCLPDGNCGCPGDFRRLSDFCILTSVNCSTTNPCPDNQQCVYTGPATGFCVCPRGYKMLSNGFCVDINECTENSPPPCAQNADCINRPGTFHCICAEGKEGDPYGDGCLERKDEGCKDDSYCHYQEACNIHTGKCYDVCANGQPCGENAICRGEQHKPSCSCPPRFSGNPLVHCFRVVECGVDYTCPGNLICLSSSTCGCPPNYNRVGDYCFVTSRNCTTDNPCPNNEECVYTGIQDGFCVCPRGYELMDRGLCRNIDECLDKPCAPGAHCTDLPGSYRCFCPEGTFGDPVIRGCTEIRKECNSHRDCPPDKECDVGSGECISPCYICGNLAVCTAVDHQALCSCPPDHIGDPFDRVYGCYKDQGIVDTRTSPPISIPPELSVMCLADGVQVSVELDGFNGVVYVKGHSQDPQCRRIVSSSERETIDFKVLFNTCGLIHINGEASFILVIQKHPKLVTYKAKAYHIKCVYSTGEKTITLGFNVSMITTSGTIANTGPPPTCIMTICTTDGKEVSSAEIGDDLLLKVNVQPDYIYGGFARSCVAKTMEDNEEIQYEVTNGDGCAADPSIFGNWHLDPEKKVLLARFNAFKFPTSNNLRFQCNIRVCFGSCPPVNCDGVDAFGRKKRQAPDVPLLGGEGYQEGTLREEIMVQSNAILTFDKQENQVAPPTEEPEVEKIDKVCLPKLGLIVSLVITTLLALVAVAVAISCWLMAYRRRPKAAGPLPHPPDFPNPLYTTPEPVAEPSPDYYPSSHPQYVDDKLWTSPSSGPSRDPLMLR